jgi:hypothetical protein
VTARINVSIAMATVAIFSGLVRTDPAQAIGLVAGDSFYSDSSSFFGNTNGLQTIEFEGLAIPDSPGSGQSFQDLNLNDNTIDGVKFTGASLAHKGGANRFAAYLFSGDFLFGSPCNGSGSGCGITALLPKGITAVGASLSTFVPGEFPPFFPTTSFTISLADGSAQVISGKSGFAGFTSSSDISSIAFSIPASNLYHPYYQTFLALDDFRFGSANPATSVPEPFTVIGTLVGGTAAFRMRNKLKLAAK